jgi:hypothetical protein
MIRFSRYALPAALALIVVVNVIVFGGVAYNRSGPPESELALSERELQSTYPWRSEQDNSGVSLRLTWRVLEDDKRSARSYYGGSGGSPIWLDWAKLKSLGFDVPGMQAKAAAFERDGKWEQARAALVVLELEGPEYKKNLEVAARLASEAARRAKSEPGNAELAERAKDAADDLAKETSTYSRLFAVDAGLDLEALRARYPDRSRYAIARTLVRPQRYYSHDRANQSRAYLEPLNEDIHVPLEFKKAVEPRPRDYPSAEKEAARKYQARLAFGKRLEPWLVGVTPAK